MKVEFETKDKPINSPEWQKVIFSNENNESKSGGKFSVEIYYPSDISIHDEQIDFRNLFTIENMNRPKKLNVMIDYSFVEAVKIFGNISEAMPLLAGNFCIRQNLIEKINTDETVKKILEESNNYILPPEVFSRHIKVSEFTEEPLELNAEEIVISESDSEAPKITCINKNNFFEEKNAKVETKISKPGNNGSKINSNNKI